MKYLPRREFLMRFGMHDTAQISIWKRKRHPIPDGLKPAVMDAHGNIYVARKGEKLHSEIIRREGVYGAQEGFVFNETSLVIT